MASTLTNDQCDLCKKHQERKDASVWCFECSKFLCADCLRIHKVQNVFKDHAPIQIDEYRKLEPIALSIKYTCDNHNMKYGFYCVSHDIPICVKCVSEVHKGCDDIKPLTEVIKNVKQSFLLTDLQERASDMLVMTQNIITEVSIRQVKVRDEASRAISIVDTTREAINQHLDLIQRQIIRKIRTREKDILEQITKTLTTLRSLHRGAQETLNSLSVARRYASNFHTYCGIKLWNDKTHQREAELMSLQNDIQYFERFDIKINRKLTSLLTEITEFASIKCEHTRHEVKLLEKEMQGQKLIKNPVDSIDITLSNPRSFVLPASKDTMCVYGCCVMESGSMVFTDFFYNRLIHVDAKGKHRKDVGLSFHPFDIVEEDTDTVAVTSSWDQKLVLVNINQGREVRTVYEGERCYGLCYTDGKFFVSVSNRKIRIIGLDGVVLSSIDTVDDVSHCMVENSNLYYAIFGTDAIYCCDLTREVKWKYTCDKGDHPHGITVDNKGNVLVSCRGGNKVICIDKTGNASKMLLSEKDGMKCPNGITYNRKHNTLLVTNCDNRTCFLYTIN